MVPICIQSEKKNKYINETHSREHKKDFPLLPFNFLHVFNQELLCMVEMNGNKTHENGKKRKIPFELTYK